MIPVASGFAETIVSASDLKFGLYVALGVIIVLAAGWGAYSMLVRKRVLQDTPTALIRSASQGYIELQGHAELMDGAPIHTPLSSRICVWYRYNVEEKQRHHSGSGSKSQWRSIESGISDSLFYLVDSTGRCAVDPEGAKVTSSSRDTWYGNSRIPGAGRQRCGLDPFHRNIPDRPELPLHRGTHRAG